MVMEIVGIWIACAVWAVVGWVQGRAHLRRSQERDQERLSRIDPGPRTPGLPTNVDGEPSEVRRARMWR